MNVSVVDLASVLWKEELNESDVVSIPEISWWIRSVGIGKLNDLIHSSFDVDPTTLEITPENSFNLEEAAILLQLYLVKFYQLQASRFLGSLGINDTIEYSENGMTIRKLDRVRLSQAWLALAKQVKEDLKDLVTGYTISKSKALSIEGQELKLLSSIIPRYNRILNQGL